MTGDPQLHPDKVAELEHRLADAAAEVARVQAELSSVKAGDPAVGAPPAAADRTTPHVIEVNGQQATPGTGDLAALLRQALPSGTASSPVVIVNGQNVSGGQPLDLSRYVTPQVMEQMQSSLQQLGLSPGLQSLFGHAGGTAAGGAPPPVQERLAEPPRQVPLGYRLATFDLSFYELFLLFIGTVAPVIVWITVPQAVPAALIAAVAVIATFRARRYLRRIGLLRWGKVATVTQNETLSAGTYYSGVTYNNMRKRRASGWDAETIWYSGPGYKNRVDYTLDGKPGVLTYRGLLYTDGVILADSRDASKALCVSQFPYSVKPGPDGQLPGRLPILLWVGIVFTVVVELAVASAAVVAVLTLWMGR